MAKIIAFTGYAGCGKSYWTTETIKLIHKINPNATAVRMAFADEIKRYGEQVGIVKGNVDFRQRISDFTKPGREIGAWCQLTECAIRALNPVVDFIVIEDVRFVYEVQMLLNYNTSLFGLIRPGIERIKVDTEDSVDKILKEFWPTTIFENTGTIESNESIKEILEIYIESPKGCEGGVCPL